MKIVFATGNKGKFKEAREILGPGYELLCPADLGITDDIEENGNTLKENSIIKARYIHEKTGLDCFADDTGLEVDALGGLPGIHAARFAEMMGHAGASHDFQANRDVLLAELAKHPGEPRTARFRCVVTLILGNKEYYFDGCLEGMISEKESGTRGFGYDPVFIADEFPSRTLAEIRIEDKDAVSHRGKSLRAMAEFLQNQYICVNEEKEK